MGSVLDKDDGEHGLDSRLTGTERELGGRPDNFLIDPYMAYIYYYGGFDFFHVVFQTFRPVTPFSLPYMTVLAIRSLYSRTRDRPRCADCHSQKAIG